MTDPRIEGSLGDLNFRAPARSMSRRIDPPSHFWLGVAIFIAVALAYPFYSYHVQSQLMAREIASALTDASTQMDGMGRQAQRDSREIAMQAAHAAAQSAATRQGDVEVAGTTMVGGTRIVIVRLGQASLNEARANICRQAAASFDQPLAGERLRVQRHRGSRPAVDIGTVTCN